MTTQQVNTPVKVYKTMSIVEMWQSGVDIFRYLLRKWWIIALIGFVGGVCGFLFAYFEKPKYESHLTFALDNGGSGIGGALSLAAEFGLSLGGNNNLFEGDNILTLLTSRRIIERVLLSPDTVNGKVMTMAEYYKLVTADSTEKKSGKKMTELEKRISNISFPVDQPRESFSYLQDSVLMNMYKAFAMDGNLSVGRPDKKLNFYEVSVKTPNERFTKRFTDKLVKEATDFYTELRTKKSKNTLDILELRVNQTKGALNSAINNRAGIQDANINPAFQEAQARIQQKQVDISAYGGAYGELYKNLELARYQYLQDIPLLQIIDGAEYPMKRVKKGKLVTAVLFAILFDMVALVVFFFIYFSKKKLAEERALATNVSTTKIPDQTT